MNQYFPWSSIYLFDNDFLIMISKHVTYELNDVQIHFSVL